MLGPLPGLSAREEKREAGALQAPGASPQAAAPHPSPSSSNPSGWLQGGRPPRGVFPRAPGRRDYQQQRKK